MAEAGRFRPPSAVEHNSVDLARQRAALEAQRERLRTQHQLGVTDDDELVVRWDAIRTELEAIEAQESTDVLLVPRAIDWVSWAPQHVNTVLRAMWRFVELDEKLDPVRAHWIVPEWRAD